MGFVLKLCRTCTTATTTPTTDTILLLLPRAFLLRRLVVLWCDAHTGSWSSVFRPATPPARWPTAPLLYCSCCFHETRAETTDRLLPAWRDCVFHETAGLRFPLSSPAAAAATRYGARIFAPRPALSSRHGSGLSLTCCKTRRC